MRDPAGLDEPGQRGQPGTLFEVLHHGRQTPSFEPNWW